MAAVLIPLAHVGHWLWVLYLPPVLIVLGSILRSTLVERRRKTDVSSVGGTGDGGRGQPVDSPQVPIPREQDDPPSP